MERFWLPGGEGKGKAPEADPIEAPDWITWRVFKARGMRYVAQFHNRHTGHKVWVTANTWREGIEWVRWQVKRAK